MIVVKSCFPNYSYYYYYWRYVCVCVCVCHLGGRRGKKKGKGFLKSARLEVLKKKILYRFVLFIRYVLIRRRSSYSYLLGHYVCGRHHSFSGRNRLYFSTLLSWHIIIIPQHPCRDKTKYVVVCTKKNGERWLSSLLSVDNVMVGYRIIPTCDHGEKEVGKKNTLMRLSNSRPSKSFSNTEPSCRQFGRQAHAWMRDPSKNPLSPPLSRYVLATCPAPLLP